MTDRNKIPRSADDDYSAEIVAERQRFIEEQTGYLKELGKMN